MSGSDKQIKWANDIRNSLAPELANYAAYYTNNGKTDTNNMFKIASSGKGAIAKDIEKTYKSRKHEPNSSISVSQVSEYNRNVISSAIDKYKELSGRINRLNQITSQSAAKWWIENRNKKKELKDYIDGKRKKI